MGFELNLKSAEELRVELTEEQRKYIENMYAALAKKIAKEAQKAPKTATDFLRQQFLQDLQKDIDRELKEMRSLLKDKIEGTMEKTVEGVIDANREFLKEFDLPFRTALAHIPPNIVQEVTSGKLYEGNWSLSRALWKQEVHTSSDINKVIAEGIAQNKSAYDIAKDLEQYVKPSARKEWDWSKVYPHTARKVDYNAQRLARTMVSHAYERAFVESTKDNPFVTEYEWRASGARTCPLCADRDGQHFPKDDLPLDHPNGMCTFIAVIPDSYEQIADRLADWANGNEDAALDKYAESLYGKGWEERTEKSADILMQNAMKNEFRAIDEALNKFLHSDGSKTLEEMYPDLDIMGGHIEKYSVQNIIETYIKPFNDDLKSYGDGFEYFDSNQAISILYKDGKVLLINPDTWNGAQRIPTSNIDSVIVENDWGIAIAGKNVRLYNTREAWEYGKYGYRDIKARYNDANDIRADFK